MVVADWGLPAERKGVGTIEVIIQALRGRTRWGLHRPVVLLDPGGWDDTGQCWNGDVKVELIVNGYTDSLRT